jgi:hypothetical protein
MSDRFMRFRVNFGFAFVPGHRRVWHYGRDRGW